MALYNEGTSAAPTVSSIASGYGNGAKGVAAPSKEVEAMRPLWDMTNALLGGTKAMRDAGPEYLPKWVNESDDKYARRIRVSTLFPAFKRTVVTLGARPFSKPITLNKEIPAKVKALLDDVDMQGRNLDMFGADAMQLEMGPGFGGILVDHKKSPAAGTGRTLSIAEEKAAGMRPYMILVRPEQILGWKHQIQNGEDFLTQLRIMECVQEDDGEFQTKEVKQVRVLEPGKWRTFRKTKVEGAVEEWAEYERGTTTLDKIPFVPFYG